MTELTQARLKELLHYNPDTGLFTWLIRPANRVRIGDIAGTLSSWGYICIVIQGQSYRAHRLAWLFTYGAWPLDQIDHINRVKDDNRLANLREATHSQNNTNSVAQKNNLSGKKGVSRAKDRSKWSATISINGKTKRLGQFTCKQEAHAAYCKAADKHYKEFANHG